MKPTLDTSSMTVRGSAQWGKTVSVLNPTLGAWHGHGPLDSLVVHPTSSAATEWVRTKWMPMRRQAPALRAVFGEGRGEQTDTLHNQAGYSFFEGYTATGKVVTTLSRGQVIMENNTFTG